MKNKKLQGYLMAGIGFALLLFNAGAVVFKVLHMQPAFTVLGLVFVILGLRRARNESAGK